MLVSNGITGFSRILSLTQMSFQHQQLKNIIFLLSTYGHNNRLIYP